MSHNLKTKNETVIKTKGTHHHDCDSSECEAVEERGVRSNKRKNTTFNTNCDDCNKNIRNFHRLCSARKMATCCDQVSQKNKDLSSKICSVVFIKYTQSTLSYKVLCHFVYMYCYQTERKKTFVGMFELVSEEKNPYS